MCSPTLMMCCDRDALLPSMIQCNAVQMSERLQDLERTVTSGAAADGDGSTTSKRSLSVGMTRKPSLIIRRTLSSFRWAFSPCQQLCACCSAFAEKRLFGAAMQVSLSYGA